MAKTRVPRKRDIENYAHQGKERVNNPPVGLVTPQTDQDAGRKTYAHDPPIRQAIDFYQHRHKRKC